jgi:arabinogalactan endo-1,4-beta-galactosidase
MHNRLKFALALFLAACCTSAPAQTYAVGADVSFLAKAEQDGVVFKDNGKAMDALTILRNHHYNWVRLRIFRDPAVGQWKLPNDLDYTLALARRAHTLGLHFLLDFHYADSWADPGKQPTPDPWLHLTHKQLTKRVYRYTRDTVAAFARAGLMPDMVQVGNEITNGMLWPDGKLPANWNNFADLVKAGIRGVRAGRHGKPMPQIMIHIDRGGDPAGSVKFFDQLLAHNVSFDVIGLSYYPWWHGSIDSLQQNLRNLAARYNRPIVVVEAAYNWTPAEYKGAEHKDKDAPFPETPEGQLAFLKAVDAAVRATPGGLGQGVFWWEPCVEGRLRTRGFFDNDNNALPVIHTFDPAQ